MGWRRAGTLVLALVLAVAACTDEPGTVRPEPAPADDSAPTPAPGLRVGVVLPPGDPAQDRELGYLQTDVRGVGATLPDGIAELRLVVPDDGVFVPDMAQLLVQRGAHMVCVIGTDSRRVVADLALVRPDLTYCAAPASSGSPPNQITLVDVRFEEVGHAVGVAAAAHSAADPVGVVIGADRIGREPFLQGLRAAVGEEHLLERITNGPDAALEAVEELIDEGAATIVVNLGAGGVQAVALAAEHVAFASPTSLVPGPPASAAMLVSWRVRWDLVLRPVLAQVAGDDVIVPEAVGLADEVLRVTPGGAMDIRVRGLLDAAVVELADGTRDPLAPLPREVTVDDLEDEEEGDPDSAGDATNGTDTADTG